MEKYEVASTPFFFLFTLKNFIVDATIFFQVS